MEHQAFEMNATLVTLSVGGADSVTWCWCRRIARTWPRTSASTGGYRCGQTRAISTSLGRRCLRAQQQLRWSVQLASGLSVARDAQRRARSSRWSRSPPLKELCRPRHGRRSLQPVHVQCRMGSSLAWSSAQHGIGGSLWARGGGPSQRRDTARRHERLVLQFEQRATAPDPDLDPNADPNSASVPVPPRSRPGGAARGTCGSRTDSSRCSCNSRTRNSRTRSSRASGSAARGLAGPDCWNPRTPTSRTRSSRTSGSAARGLPGPASARGRPALVQLLCHLPTPRAGA